MARFTCILWPPASEHFDAIEEEMNQIIPVVKSRNYTVKGGNFKKFLFGIYKPDKTPESRLNRKYKAMRKHGNSVRVVQIDVDNPTMKPHKKARLKGTFYCEEAKRLKRVIREMFSPKVEGYIYDIIIHVSDHEDHNRRARKLIKKYGERL